MHCTDDDNNNSDRQTASADAGARVQPQCAVRARPNRVVASHACALTRASAGPLRCAVHATPLQSVTSSNAAAAVRAGARADAGGRCCSWRSRRRSRPPPGAPSRPRACLAPFASSCSTAWPSATPRRPTMTRPPRRYGDHWPRPSVRWGHAALTRLGSAAPSVVRSCSSRRLQRRWRRQARHARSRWPL